MITKKLTPFSIRTALFAGGLTLASGQLYADATFTFLNGGPLDSVGVGATATELDSAENIPVTVETVDVMGQDGSLASGGEKLHTTNSTNSSNNLGVNDVDNPGGYGSESRDFNPGEAWIFKFDVDVKLMEIDFAGQSEDEVMTLSSSAFSDIVLDDIETNGTHDLFDTPVPAGTEIMIQMTAPLETGTGTRISYLTVVAVPAASTGADLVWAGADGANWNLTDAEFTDAGSPSTFATGDNVTIQTPGAITIEGSGITAGSLIDTTTSGSVTLQTGDLSVSSLTKSGEGSLVLASPLTLDTGSGVCALSGGTLQVSDGASLTSGIITISDGATLQVDAGGSITNSGPNTLDSGGGILDLDEDISLGAIGNAVVDPDITTPLTKSGVGMLTLTGNLGVQKTAPVDLQITGGSLMAVGNSTQLNVSGTCTFDGDLILDGATVSFHGATVSGSGEIIAQSAPATIISRFGAGTVEVDNTITMDSDLIIDAPTGNSLLFLNGEMSGDGNLIKDGNGVVTLGGSNTYIGTTTVESGTLRVGNDLDGTLGEGDVTLNETTSLGILEFARNDEMVVESVIHGTGNVTVNGGPESSTELSEFNDYTGTTSILGGTLVATVLADGDEPSSIGAAPFLPEFLLIRNGGSLSYTGPEASTNREFTLGGNGGGSISVDGSGPLTFTSEYAMGVNGDGEVIRYLTLAGSAPGTSVMGLAIPDGNFSMHGIIKDGSTSWSLTGDNSYTGPTTVNEGTLSLASDFLDDASTVSIAAVGILDLPHGLGDIVDALLLDGVQVAAGTYGSATAVAAIPGAIADDTHFSGSGYLIVTSDPVANDYNTWALGFGLVGGPADDDDGDGVSNEDEYAFGLDPSDASSVNPISDGLDPATGSFSYTRRNPNDYATGLSYSYSYSTTLSGDWTDFTADIANESSDDGDPVETITITLPASLLENTKLFIQVSSGTE